MKKISCLLMAVVMLLLCGCIGDESAKFDYERQIALNHGDGGTLASDGEYLYVLRYGELFKMQENAFSEADMQYVTTIDPNGNSSTSNIYYFFHFNGGIYYLLREDSATFKWYFLPDGSNISEELLPLRNDFDGLSFITSYDGKYFYVAGLKKDNAVYRIDGKAFHNYIDEMDTEAYQVLLSKFEGSFMYRFLDFVNDIPDDEFEKFADLLCTVEDATSLDGCTHLKDYLLIDGEDSSGEYTQWIVDKNSSQVIPFDFESSDLGIARLSENTFTLLSQTDELDTLNMWVLPAGESEPKKLSGVNVWDYTWTTEFGNEYSNRGSGSVAVFKDYIFFIESPTQRVCRIDTDGRNLVALANEKCTSIKVIDDQWLYCTNWEDGSWFRISSDGKTIEHFEYN